MKFKIGDKVNFLDDKGGGIVTRIIDENIVHVEIEDGFEVPVVVSNLILASPEARHRITEDDHYLHSYENNSYQKEKKVIPLQKDAKSIPAEGIYFAISPENQDKPLAGNLILYLVNHTDYRVLFSLFNNASGDFYGFDSGYLPANSKIKLDVIDRSKIELWVNALVQLIFFKDGETNILRPLSKLIDFKPVKIYKEDAFRHTGLFESKALMVKLGLIKDMVVNPYMSDRATGDNPDLLRQKLASERNNEKIRHKKASSFLDKHNLEDKVAEVDLHTHKLVDDFTNLEPVDLLGIQMDYFKKCLKEAESKKYRKIIFIHGIGDGILKNEILKHLQKTDGVQYYDAPYSRYGMGATEVRFYRHK